MTIRYRRDLIKLLDHYELPKCAAEIGVAEGLFSRDMLCWGIDKLYCVDNWAHIPRTKGDGNSATEWHVANYENAKQLLAPWDRQGKVVWLKGMSVKMADQVPDKTLGLLYLDADHSLDAVLEDLIAWMPKVVGGGIIAGHDYLNRSYGVREAVDYYCRHRYEVNVLHEDKQEDAGFWFKNTKF